jgi:hypothetical protein
MIEKILKDTYVNPKVELTQNEYNNLVALARMKAKKIEERAREIYEKEGVVKIDFSCNLYRKRYGEVENDRYKFQCDCGEWGISPSGDYEKTLFKVPEKDRQRIAKHVKSIVEDAFYYYFGEHMLNLNEIERLKHKQQQMVNKFIILTVVGWLMAVLMLIYVILK